MSSFPESMSSGDPNSKDAKGEPEVTSSGSANGKGSGFSVLSICDPKFSSSGLTKPVGKGTIASGVSIGDPKSCNPNGRILLIEKIGIKAAISSSDRGKAIVSGSFGEVMSFREVTFGSHEGEVRFRLIHFWEARNSQTKVLIGMELLLIDEEAQ